MRVNMFRESINGNWENGHPSKFVLNTQKMVPILKKKVYNVISGLTCGTGQTKLGQNVLQPC